MLTLISFVVTLGILIAVHEYGHYRVAVACGIKVLKFSIGFGKPIYTWKLKNKSTEFSIGMLPLGGYVKMLDEREAPVDPAERHLAFNTQPLKSRAAVVAAGPAANLLLAVLLYAILNWSGLQEPKAVLSSPVAGSLAEKAGLRGQETVAQAAFEGDELQDVRSFEDLRWRLTQGALDGRDLTLVLGGDTLGAGRTVRLALSTLGAPEADAQLFRKIGILGPWTRPEIGNIKAGSPAERSGLRAGDVVVRIGDTAIMDGRHLREAILASALTSSAGKAAVAPQSWQIIRAGQPLVLQVTPELQLVNGMMVPRIEAAVDALPELVTVRYGFVDGLWQGAVRTWQVSTLTLRLMGKMLTGQASLKNLSGPLTIADYAGKSASLGLSYYLTFLALVSVSLGVLNLLPLPVLDGGHLMYYLWEGITGRGVSDAWMDRLQRGGVAILLGMMCVALFNDVTRLLG
ncbi:RIP metalloprotease RseP [Polaromonas sp. LjRoot131]|uniref:RIP metalloprotease RseP n=1 Tax=Polaromonas sp. LjRoot131 TaxID=3342262 RepID=UPI003ECCCA15